MNPKGLPSDRATPRAGDIAGGNDALSEAVLFDLDGVLTDTAGVHADCWKLMFDTYLRERSARTGEPFREFNIDEDYFPYVDGKPRYDGVRSFLAHCSGPVTPHRMTASGRPATAPQPGCASRCVF